jgi:hypothetical protein
MDLPGWLATDVVPNSLWDSHESTRVGREKLISTLDNGLASPQVLRQLVYTYQQSGRRYKMGKCRAGLTYRWSENDRDRGAIVKMKTDRKWDTETSMADAELLGTIVEVQQDTLKTTWELQKSLDNSQ